MPQANREGAAKLSLGQYLASVREDRGLSRREVEAATGNIVSTEYLSQIENDRIKKPSPDILRRLSELYCLSYEELMERAGFVAPSRSRANSRVQGHIVTFVNQNLTEEEEAELDPYLSFMRSQKRAEGQA